MSPLFYDTPGDPPSSPSQQPSSYHPSPMKPAHKRRSQVNERATPPKTVYQPGSGYTTSEEEEQPEEGLFTRAWLPPRQSPEETLTQFRARPHQYHLNRDERFPVSRVLPDNAYGNRPAIKIERDLQQGLDAIQEERMIVEPTPAALPRPTNEDDDIGDMYSSKWICHHMTLAVDSSPSPLPKTYKDVLKLPKQEQELWTASIEGGDRLPSREKGMGIGGPTKRS